jgi:hypothetical protein
MNRTPVRPVKPIKVIKDDSQPSIIKVQSLTEESLKPKDLEVATKAGLHLSHLENVVRKLITKIEEYVGLSVIFQTTSLDFAPEGNIVETTPPCVALVLSDFIRKGQDFGANGQLYMGPNELEVKHWNEFRQYRVYDLIFQYYLMEVDSQKLMILWEKMTTFFMTLYYLDVDGHSYEFKTLENSSTLRNTNFSSYGVFKGSFTIENVIFYNIDNAIDIYEILRLKLRYRKKGSSKIDGIIIYEKNLS